MYDVPLMVSRGYASLSFLYSSAEEISTLVVPTYIYHLGDFDPSGVNAGEKIEDTLRQLAAGCGHRLPAHRGHRRADHQLGFADTPDQNVRHSRERLRQQPFR
jgi:hypothetical protein